MNKDRDIDIVRRYKEGEPLSALEKMFGLSRARIYQILRTAGTPRRRRAPVRDRFLGVNLSSPVKKALREEALRRGVSMSSLSSDMLKEMLIACGHSLEAQKI